MFVIQAFFFGNQLAFRLILYTSTLLFFSPLIQADSRANTTALSLINKTYLNKTPQLSYKISSTSKGITARPALKGMSTVSISRSSGINHSVQINGEEHFVAASPTTDGKGLIVQTQASNGTSAHLLKVYPVQTSGQSHRYYVKDESSGATFLATTSASASSITVQQTGNKTTDEDCDGGYRVQGKCQPLPAYAGPVIIGVTFTLIAATVIICVRCCKYYQSHSAGSSSFALGFIGEDGGGVGCE
ncbi:hypothetical protein [Endozoicomonas euniceicola]|uniref:Uncharacterized protein n=1 Tax=Endozoicomonas euniceicola TaxID=1234143 RepID=A0ABY6H0W0_9GAMM|nr:hypothetical protein [Endozoicomonas euniceicola]UYM18698.1 hypothetical protein NX720_12590 [Endozoicomonas euniceicola]